MDLSALSAEFPRASVSWRAQSLTKAGDKAMALAYIDARDVMERLDAVCGVEGWQCDYPHAGAKTVCRIGIKVGDEWVWKSNGAGDSDIEAEKGALSDAFKRAAVLWGIGRYLYSLESPWVPCETYESNGKKHWKRWTVDPWSCVRGSKPAPAATVEQSSFDAFRAAIAASADLSQLAATFTAIKADKTLTRDEVVQLALLKDDRKIELSPKNPSPAQSLDGLESALQGMPQ